MTYEEIVFERRVAAIVHGTEESLDGMSAYLEHSPADFDQFRNRNTAALDQYRSEQGHNQGDASRAARP